MTISVFVFVFVVEIEVEYNLIMHKKYQVFFLYKSHAQALILTIKTNKFCIIKMRYYNMVELDLWLLDTWPINQRV